MKRIAVLLAGFVLAGSVWGADRNGNFLVQGVGNNTCSDYVSKVDEDKVDQAGYVAWLGGYISGYNSWMQYTHDIKGNAGMAELGEWLYKNCKNNPRKRFMAAVQSLVRELYPNRSQTAKRSTDIDAIPGLIQ